MLNLGAIKGAFFFNFSWNEIMKNHRFLFAVSLISLLSAPITDCYAACAQHHSDLKVRVSKVYDGDTLQLVDGTRIRIIGVNAPESGRRGQPDEAFARQAKSLLQSMLSKHQQLVSLQYGPDRLDRYGRTLAHVFLDDGSNIAEQLLLKGLASRVAFPPNLWAQDCYQRSEALARSQNLGIWLHIVTPVDKVSLSDKGFRIIEGKVTRVAESKKSIWLNFNEHFAVRIARKDLHQFSQTRFKQLKGRRLQVRGWMYGYKDKKIIQLRHSSMLEIMK